MEKYYCNCCNYITESFGNFKKHIFPKNTKKTKKSHLYSNGIFDEYKTKIY